MTTANSVIGQPDAIEYDPIPLKPKPKPTPPTPHPPAPSPTTPMAPTPAPETVAGLNPVGLSAGAAGYSATFVLSVGERVKPQDVERGTKVYVLDKVLNGGELKLTPLTRFTPKASATSDPFTYEVQVSTKNPVVKGKTVFVFVYLPALGKAGVTSGEMA